VVEAAEHGDRGELTGCGCSSRSEPARARGRLDAQAAMRSSVVVGDILAQDALGVVLAEDEDVIEAVAPERAHQALANRVRHWRSRRREKASHPETTESSTQARVVDAVAVAQQITWRRVADSLDHALRHPRARRGAR